MPHPASTDHLTGRRLIPYYILSLLAILPLPLLRGLALLVAGVLNLFPKHGLRWTVRVNLLLVAPHLPLRQRLALERANVSSQCLTAVESVKSWGMPPAYSTAQITHIDGLAILQDALNDHRGLMAIVPHLGTWEMMNAWVSAKRAPVIMYKPNRNAGLNAFILRGRERLEAQLVPTDESGVRQLFKTLKQGGFTVILPDHVPPMESGTYAPYFRIDALCTTLANKLIQKTKCRVIMLACFRNARGSGFHMVCREVDSAIYTGNLTQSITVLNHAIEQLVLLHPEQYLWGYRRFRFIPALDGVYRWPEDKIMTLKNTNLSLTLPRR